MSPGGLVCASLGALVSFDGHFSSVDGLAFLQMQEPE
jgi:hypothetical protein